MLLVKDTGLVEEGFVTIETYMGTNENPCT